MATGYRADGVITIGTSVDVGGINTGLNKITKAMGKLTSSFKSILGLAAFTKLANEALEYASDLTEVQNIVDVSFEDMSYKIESFAQTCIEQYGISELTAKQTAGQYAAMGKSMGLTLDEATSMAVQLTGLTADFASFYNLNQEYARTAMSAVYTGETETLKRYGIVITEANLQEYALTQGITESVQAMSARNKLILRYKYIMQATADMQGDFARTSTSWANQVRVLQQRWQSFLGVLGSGMKVVLTPLLQLLNKLLSAVISLANAIGSVLARIFGIDVDAITGSTSSGLDDVTSSAEDTADAEDDLADATSAAADAADKALGSYDKLDVIQKKTSSDTSSSGSDDDPFALDFSDIDFGSSLMDKITDSVLDNIDTLYDLGRYINQTLQDMLDSIPWDTIFDGARKFGTGLAEFLNGLIDPDLFYKYGATVANGLNTILYAVQSFGEEFDFTNLGESLNAKIRGEFETFDYDALKDAAYTWGTGIGDLINGVISVDMFEDVAHGIAEGLNAAIIFAFQLGDTIDFWAMGEALAAGINQFLTDFDFEQLAETINVWVDNLWEFIVSFVTNLDWGKVFTGIFDFITSLDVDTFATLIGWFALKKLIKDLAELKLGTAIAEALTSSKLWKDIGLRIKWFYYEIKDILIYHFDIIKTFFTETVIPTVTEWFSTVGSTIGGVVAIIAGVVIAVKSFVDMWQNGWTLCGEVIKDFGIALGVLGAIILGVEAPIAIVVGVAVAAVTLIANLVKDHWDWFQEKWSELIDWISDKWSKFTDWAEKAIQDTIEFITNRLKEIFQFLQDLVSSAVGIIEAGFQLIADIVTTVLDTLYNIFVGAFNWIKDLVGDVIDVFKNIITFLQDVFTGNWSNIWTDIVNIFGSIWDTMVDFAKGPINLIIDLVNGLIGVVESAVNFIINALDKISFDVPSWVPAIGGKTFGFNISQVSIPRVPRLAQGAVIPPNKEFMAVLGDQKSGTNIETPLDTMVDAFTKALDARDKNTDTGDIVVQIDGKEVFRAVRNQNKEYKNTTGKSAFA
jgi:hypothetical protein